MMTMPNVLIVEDDRDWLDIYLTELASETYNIITARTIKKVTQLLAEQEFAVVATDLRLLGVQTGGFEVLDMVRQQSPDTQVIIFTGYGSQQLALEAMQRGAYDYVTKPIDYDHVKLVIQKAIEVREQKIAHRRPDLPFPERFVGSSQIVKDMLRQVAKVIKSNKPILIQGESGTGKALITETIYLASQRKRFVLVNCPSYSETTLEHILFGDNTNEQGAFSLAHEGTLILDRVNAISPRLQNQLATVLANSSFQPLGKNEPQMIDNVQIIATSRINLAEYVQQGLFLPELYQQLSHSVITLPLLKERKDKRTDDILLLAGYFLDKYKAPDGTTLNLSEKVKTVLQKYEFPLNVRELEEIMRVAIIQAKSGMIEVEHLPPYLLARQLPLRAPLSETFICPHGYTLYEQVAAISQDFDTQNYVYVTLGNDASAWVQTAIANILKQFGLQPHPATVQPENSCSICQPLLASHLAVIDISNPTPQTFYSLGLFHAIGVPCLILKHKKTSEFTQLGKIKLHEYHDENSLKEVINTWLTGKMVS